MLAADRRQGVDHRLQGGMVDVVRAGRADDKQDAAARSRVPQYKGRPSPCAYCAID
jgi:hypothetical protein